MKSKAILVDITKCIGCKQCEAACKAQNKLPEVEETKLSATAYTVIDEHEERYVRRLCMHCKYPTCESVCPVGAFSKTEIGAVVYDSHKCIGCRYCMMACPFQVPTYEWMSLTPKVQKCKFCYEKILEGGTTACVEACPAEAAIFGDYNDLIKEAHRIISENPDKYVNHIYGENEVGGTSILYISDVPFEKLGFKTHLETQPLPELTWSALSKIPSIVMVGGTLLYGIWWITNRRKEVVEFERKLKENNEENN
ncbi:MAG: 4Fe-4S dicluster domain-containing protein [Bacteroidetes bacterium]|nr:4Fe-4S dicluster domain-containing protein [Bacteroidota bacterium]MBU1423594.1 4Fe-4S dicluster domain-containing protein [Bacteroidota bacterium]MBU2472079.1 4Fe-4S dicluster domain-containing protein [Bacteroidota bacterium]MBU2635790.1 4Fe-4S dicluster domain-containing protein [Bacteroidota bacterium]